MEIRVESAQALRTMSTEMRLAYTRRVLGLVVSGLLVATIGAKIGMMDGVVQTIEGLGFFSIFIMIGTIIWAQKAAKTQHAAPVYFLFTFVMGLLLGPLVYIYSHRLGGPAILGNAVLLTGINVSALAAYTWISKKDFSFMGNFLFIGLLTIIGISIVGMFVGSSALTLGISVAGVLLFNGFLLYDLGRVMNSTTYIPPTQAALELFLDVFNLFLFILRILGGRD